MYGERIKNLRKINHMTQGDLASLLHVSQGAITLWEREGRMPDIPTVIKIAECFGVSVDYVLGTDNEKSTQLLLSADELIELSNSLDQSSREAWLSFGRFLLSNSNNNAKTNNSLPESSSEL